MSSSDDCLDPLDAAISAKSRLNNIKYNVHTPFQKFTPEHNSMLAEKLSIPVHLMLLNLDGNMNVAMSVRSAAVLGISDVWIVGRRKYDARPEVGAKHYVRVHKTGDLADPIAFFEEQGLQPILVEQGGIPLEEMNFGPFIRSGKPVCFVLGSESEGINPDWLRQMCGAPRITIAQYGMIRSLNVSIAASITLYEYLKQWRAYRLSGV
jgi:tRNA G18 (ribose-2'-O)-methylase SpoU